jgi:hypothetical protein
MYNTHVVSTRGLQEKNPDQNMNEKSREYTYDDVDFTIQLASSDEPSDDTGLAPGDAEGNGDDSRSKEDTHESLY